VELATHRTVAWLRLRMSVDVSDRRGAMEMDDGNKSRKGEDTYPWEI
jgi:hypothetical protein